MMLSLLSALFFVLTIVNSQKCPTRTSIEKSLIDAHVPGAVMIVVNTTGILYQEAFGHQSFLPTQLVDVEKSIFLLASISKTFIAAAVMQLVELKQLDLDVDINRYLLSTDPKIFHPLYPAHAITLRQLLSHSASIGKNFDEESYFFQPDDRVLAETTLAEACFHFLTHNDSNWLPNPPGTVTLYSNVGSSLAALVVERVTNISYAQYVRDKILQPLGIDLDEAGFYLSDIKNQENLVRHYTYNSSQVNEWEKMTPQLNLTQVIV